MTVWMPEGPSWKKFARCLLHAIPAGLGSAFFVYTLFNIFPNEYRPIESDNSAVLAFDRFIHICGDTAIIIGCLIFLSFLTYRFCLHIWYGLSLVTFTRQGVKQTRLGRCVKQIPWEEVAEVGIIHIYPKTDSLIPLYDWTHRALCFCPGILSDRERAGISAENWTKEVVFIPCKRILELDKLRSVCPVPIPSVQTDEASRNDLVSFRRERQPDGAWGEAEISVLDLMAEQEKSIREETYSGGWFSLLNRFKRLRRPGPGVSAEPNRRRNSSMRRARYTDEVWERRKVPIVLFFEILPLLFAAGLLALLFGVMLPILIEDFRSAPDISTYLGAVPSVLWTVITLWLIDVTVWGSAYYTLDEEGIVVRTLLYKKRIRWDEIRRIAIYTMYRGRGSDGKNYIVVCRKGKSMREMLFIDSYQARKGSFFLIRYTEERAAELARYWPEEIRRGKQDRHLCRDP